MKAESLLEGEYKKLPPYKMKSIEENVGQEDDRTEKVEKSGQCPIRDVTTTTMTETARDTSVSVRRSSVASFVSRLMEMFEKRYYANAYSTCPIDFC